MRHRSFGIVLALLIAATPALAVVCKMNCEQVAADSTCHEAQNAPGEQTLRSIDTCDHHHSTGSPVLQASANARHSVGPLIAAPLARLAPSATSIGAAAGAGVHAPPGSAIPRAPSSSIAILRV